MPRQPRIRTADNGRTWDVYLDSPLGYELAAGGFSSRHDAEDWLDWYSEQQGRNTEADPWPTQS